MKNHNQQNRDYSFDFIKGLLIYLVIYGHVLYAWGGSQIIYVVIYSFHMPLFIFISGYFARRTLSLPIGDCVKRTWDHLLLPAVIWTAVYFFVFHLFANEDWPRKIIYSMRCVWFLYCLSFLYFLGNIVWKFRYKYVLAIVVAVLGFSFYRIPGVAYVEYFQPIRLWPSFVMGLFWGEYRNQLHLPVRVFFIIFCLLAYFTSFAASLKGGASLDYVLSSENYLIRAVIYLSGSILVFALLQFLFLPLWKADLTRPMVIIGQNTMGIYVMNGLIIGALSKYIKIWCIPLWMASLIITVFLYGATVAFKKSRSCSKLLLGESK